MARLNCRAGYTTDTRCNLKLLKKGTTGEFGETFENVFKWLKTIFSQKKIIRSLVWRIPYRMPQGIIGEILEIFNNVFILFKNDFFFHKSDDLWEISSDLVM